MPCASEENAGDWLKFEQGDISSMPGERCIVCRKTCVKDPDTLTVTFRLINSIEKLDCVFQVDHARIKPHKNGQLFYQTSASCYEREQFHLLLSVKSMEVRDVGRLLSLQRNSVNLFSTTLCRTSNFLLLCGVSIV